MFGVIQGLVFRFCCAGLVGIKGLAFCLMTSIIILQVIVNIGRAGYYEVPGS